MPEFHVGEAEVHADSAGGIQGNLLTSRVERGCVANRKLVVGVRGIRRQKKLGALKRDASGGRGARIEVDGLLDELAIDGSAGELQQDAQGLRNRRGQAVVELALTEGEFGKADSGGSGKRQVEGVVDQRLGLGLGRSAVDEQVAARQTEFECIIGINGHVGAGHAEGSGARTAEAGEVEFELVGDGFACQRGRYRGGIAGGDGPQVVGEQRLTRQVGEFDSGANGGRVVVDGFQGHGSAVEAGRAKTRDRGGGDVPRALVRERRDGRRASVGCRHAAGEARRVGDAAREQAEGHVRASIHRRKLNVARLKALHDRGLARQFKELSHTHLQQVGLAVHQPVGLVGVDGDKGGIRVEHVTQGEVDRTDGHNDSGSKGDVEVVNSE